MELAKLARAVIEPSLRETSAGWAYEDRVLVMLVPSLSENVTAFYEGHGAPLAETFREHQIGHMDRGLVGELLQLVARRSPEAAVAVVRMAARRPPRS